MQMSTREVVGWVMVALVVAVVAYLATPAIYTALIPEQPELPVVAEPITNPCEVWPDSKSCQGTSLDETK